MGYNLDVSKISSEEWELNKCKEYATYILSKYNKTEKQLREKLKACKKKYSDNTIDAAIKFLKKNNFLNDENFAKRFVEIYKNKYSKKVLKDKLYIKGVKKSIIDKVISDNDIEFDEETIIRKLLLKKCPDYFEKKDSMDIKEKQKIFAFLFRKGFAYDDIIKVIKET